MRVACGCALAGCVGIVALRPASETRVVVAQPDQLCGAIDAIIAVAFQGIAPPVDATPEDVRAVRAANAQLAQLAEQVRGFRSREGC